MSFIGFPFPPNLVAGGIMQRIPVTQPYSALSVYYQWHPHTQGLTVGFLIRVTMLDAQLLPTASGHFNAPWTTQATWQQVVVPLTYTSTNPTVWASIQFAFGGQGNPNPPDVIGSYFLVDDVSFNAPTTVEERGEDIPEHFSLEQNYPNPFNPSTKIDFSVPKQSFVRLSVYNLLGEEVATLVNETMDPGSYVANWNAVGKPSGMYLYSLNTGRSVLTKRMMLVK